MNSKYKKKIVFFDADGTLWYPKKTKYKKHPVWIYRDGRVKNHHEHLILIPSVLNTIKELKRREIVTVILSTSPRHPKIADIYLKNKVKHFNLASFFDEVYATRPHHESKVEFIIKILKKRKIPKSKALMVGDSYNWDYKPATKKGIDSVLIKSDYMHEHKAVKNIKRTINRLSDVFKYI